MSNNQRDSEESFVRGKVRWCFGEAVNTPGYLIISYLGKNFHVRMRGSIAVFEEPH